MVESMEYRMVFEPETELSNVAIAQDSHRCKERVQFNVGV